MRHCKAAALLAGAIVVGTASVVLRAQTDYAVGSIIREFEYPVRDESGKQQALIRGREATVMSHNRIRVRDMDIEIFGTGGGTLVRVVTPDSDYWRQENRLTTASGVDVKHAAFALTAGTMNWDVNASSGLFKDNVKVILNQRIPSLAP